MNATRLMDEETVKAHTGINQQKRDLMKTLLGDEGLNAYTSQRGGRWINNLAPNGN